MKTKHLEASASRRPGAERVPANSPARRRRSQAFYSRCALLAMCCAAAAIAGCATENPQTSSLDDNVGYNEALRPTGSSQPVIRDKGAFQMSGLVSNGAVTLDEWRHFDTNVTPKENLSALDENDNVQLDVTQLQAQAPTNSTLSSIFGGSDQTNNNDDFFWEEQEFQPQGLRLFTIPF